MHSSITRLLFLIIHSYVFVLLTDSVDKRGRPIKQTSKEDLKKFYEIEKEDTNDENKPNLDIEGNNI